MQIVNLYIQKIGKGNKQDDRSQETTTITDIKSQMDITMKIFLDTVKGHGIWKCK